MRYLFRIAALSLLLPCLLAATLAAQRNRSPTRTQMPFLKQDFTILFQGDAVTGGGRQRTDPDMAHAMGQDYAYILAAQIGADIPERNLKFLNRGVGGDRVTDMAARWQTDTIALKPDILSILIGANEQFGPRPAVTPEEFEAAYDKLLAQTVAALPDTKIVLGEPFLLPVGRHVAKYDDELAEMKKRQAAVARLATKYHCAIVHYQQAFDDAIVRAPAERWSLDGIHPTPAGYGLMAREWLRTVSTAWSQTN